MNYRGTEIKLTETDRYQYVDREGGSDYLVATDGGLVFLAESKYGKSFATKPQVALDGAYKQIDNALGK